MNFNIDWKQGLVAMFFFATVMPMSIMAIHGFSNYEFDKEIDETLQMLVQIWVYLLIPITFYIAFFTKWNNPFKEIKDV